jgi:Dullard-like phosphatase family protein
MASVAYPSDVAPEEYSQFAVHVYQWLSYIKDLTPPTVEELQDAGKMVNIQKRKENKKLIVFDLDETLVHCTFKDKTDEADVFLNIKMPNGQEAKTGFNIRPYWEEMMQELDPNWEIVVFTASCKNYADEILDYLDPENKYFHHRFYRETCWQTGGVYVKDLRVFHQWSLEDIILVDNAVYSFAFQLDNGIPIIPYYRGKEDNQLLYLKEYLNLIHNKNVIRDLRRTFLTTEMFKGDIDSVVDMYAEEEEDQRDYNEMLDMMQNCGMFQRSKGHSFNAVMLSKHNFNSQENASSSNKTCEEEEEKLSVPTSSEGDELIRSKSNHVETTPKENLVDSSEIDQLLDCIKEQRSSEAKPRKKAKVRLSQLKKHQSVYTKTETQLEAKEVSNFKEGTSQEGSLGGTNTPKKHTKKKVKKRKFKHMKEVKFGFSCAETNDDLIEEVEAQQINLFKRRSSEDGSPESREKLSPRKKTSLFVSTGDSRTSQYKFQKNQDLCKSANFKQKRNSSPLGHQDLLMTNTSGKEGRKLSVTSSESSEDQFERAEENNSTATNSKKQYSRLSSADTANNDPSKTGGYAISPFEKVIEAKEGEEYSPTIDRRKLEKMDHDKERRDSIGLCLDNLQAFFSMGTASKRKSA